MKRTVRVVAITCLMSLVSVGAAAQGKIAVLSLEEAIFSTEEAKTQFAALRQTPVYVENKKKYDDLKKNYDQLIEQFQKNREVMSAEQEQEQAGKIKGLEEELQFVGKKLQQSQRDVATRVMREMGPRANTVITELIKVEGIGLLLNAQAALHADVGYSINAKVTDKLNQTKP